MSRTATSYTFLFPQTSCNILLKPTKTVSKWPSLLQNVVVDDINRPSKTRRLPSRWWRRPRDRPVIPLATRSIAVVP